MVALANPTYSFRGWKAIPTDFGGFYIHAPGAYDTLRGHAKTIEAAEEWIKEATGFNYEQLPAIKYEQLTVKVHTRKLCEFPYHGKVECTNYSLDGNFLGTIQVKHIKNRVSVSSSTGKMGIVGGDLAWILKQHNLRLLHKE